jgi:RNA polymerase sigma-70 factor (ECF subfamily)
VLSSWPILFFSEIDRHGCGKWYFQHFSYNKSPLLKDDSYISLSNEELLARYRETGDNQWLGNVLQRYTMLLLGVAMKYLRDKDEAQDAVQHVFLKSLTHLPKGEIQNFKGWLYVLMRNHCLQMLRDRTHKAAEETVNHLSAPADGKDEIQWKEFTLDQLEQAMNDLNEEQRQVIVLFYLKKLSYQQITDHTGLTFMQVKSYIQNGKRNLKLLLLKRLGKQQP